KSREANADNHGRYENERALGQERNRGDGRTRPQPIPNNPAPTTSLPSISFKGGTKNFSASSGLGRRKTRRYPTKVTTTAPSITKIKLGSKVPAKSRKFWTFPRLALPEIRSPRPK